MPISSSPLAYSDCYDAMNRALEDDRGVRLKVDTRGNAEFLRMRLNTARAINREENARTYEKGEPMHGRSEYDKLMFRIKELRSKDGTTRVYVYLEQVQSFVPEIENLSEIEDDEVAVSKHEAMQAEPEPVKVQSLTTKKNNEVPMITRRL